MRDNIKELLILALNKFNAIKVGFELVTRYFNPQIAENNLKSGINIEHSAYCDRNLIIKAEVLTSSSNLDKYYDRLINKFNNGITEGVHENSGWIIHKYVF